MDDTLPLSAFRALDLASALGKARGRECWHYHEVLGRLAAELLEEGSSEPGQAARLLSTVCSFFFRPSNGINPWQPFMIGGGRRSAMADDLSDAELKSLGAFVGEAEDPVLRARIADVLWECKQGFQFAQIAVTAYQAAAVLTEDGHRWIPLVEHLERAAELAARLGRKKPLYAGVIKQIEDLVTRFQGDLACGLLVHRLLRMVHVHNAGEPLTYAALCEKLGAGFQDAKKWSLAVSYWNLAGVWHRRAKDEQNAKRCRGEEGETMVAQAHDAEGRRKYGYSYCAGWLMRGIEILRETGCDPERVAMLHAELIALQKQALGELHGFHVDPRKLPGYEPTWKQAAEDVRTHLSGLELDEAIARFANLTTPTNVEELRKTMSDAGGDFLHQRLNMGTLDFEGKITAEVEGPGAVEDPGELHLQKRMFEWGRMSLWPLACDWYLEPGRHAIYSAHRLRMRDLAFLVHPNPFVPRGHEEIYLRGVMAGFCGDFLVATHLLAPQLEHSIRMVLKHSGVVTSTIKSGTQKEMDLGGLLTHEKAVEIFGPDVIFDLRGILIEKFGENLRNDTAHGFLPATGFNGAASCYLWWLTIRLLWLGHQFHVLSP